MKSPKPLAVISLFVFFSANAVFGQITPEGTIRGVVRDPQMASVPGASISLKSPTVSGLRPTISDNTGAYRFVNLEPGEYTIEAELPGFSRFQRTVVVRAGLNLLVDIDLTLAGTSEVVQVTNELPMLETQSTTQGINISGDLHRTLPIDANRNWYNMLEITPGLVSRQGSAGLSNHYMLRGSEIDTNRVMVDGADMSSFRQARVDYVGLSNEAINEVQVKTAGMDASAPLGSGVIVNIATPSSSDKFHGAAGFYLTPEKFNGNNSPGGTSASRKILQTELALGGPIKPGKAWFFGTVRYNRRGLGISRDQTLLTNLQALQPGFTAFDNEGRMKNYLVRGSVELTANHKLQLLYSHDNNPEDANRVTNAQSFERQSLGGYTVSTRIASTWTPSLITQVSFAYNTNSLNSDNRIFDRVTGNFFDAGPQVTVFDRANMSSGRLVGAGELAILKNVQDVRLSPTSKATFQADLTYFRSGLLGRHEFKAGVFLQPRLRNEDRRYYAGNGFSLEEVVLTQAGNPRSGYKPFHRRYFDVASLTTKDVSAKDYAIYFQDVWRPIPRLAIHGGVRIDWVEVDDRLFKMQIQDSVSVGPRTGATFMLTKDGRNTIRGHWGRLHEMLLATRIESAGSTRTRQVDRYDNNLDGIFELELITPASTALATDRLIDPDLNQPYIDEWLVGYRTQLPGQLMVDMSLVGRSYNHRPALIETNATYDGVVFKGYKNEDFNQIYLITNNKYNSFIYRGWEVSVSKQAKDFQVIGGYTYGWQHLDGTWLPKDPASFIQPDAFANNACIGSLRGNETNSLSGTSDTRCSSWQRHSLHIGGSWDAPLGFVISSQLSSLSGPWSGPVVMRLTAADPKFGTSTVKLSNGRTVSNPLATTVRFAYANRGEGQVSAPFQNLWNIRIGRKWKFDRGGLEFSFDIMNVTNNAADQEFLSGGNQTYSANYAIAPDGSFRGSSRVFPRNAQIGIRWSF